MDINFREIPMNILSNYYSILNRCHINCSAIDQKLDLPFFKTSLYSFIIDNNDEYFPYESYNLSFDKDAYQNIFKKRNITLLQIKIVLMNVSLICREMAESFISYSYEKETGYIKLFSEYKESEKYNLSTVGGSTQADIQLYDVDSFLKNLGDKISLEHYWITAFLFDSETGQGLILDSNTIDRFGIIID